MKQARRLTCHRMQQEAILAIQVMYRLMGFTHPQKRRMQCILMNAGQI